MQAKTYTSHVDTNGMTAYYARREKEIIACKDIVQKLSIKVYHAARDFAKAFQHMYPLFNYKMVLDASSHEFICKMEAKDSIDYPENKLSFTCFLEHSENIDINLSELLSTYGSLMQTEKVRDLFARCLLTLKYSIISDIRNPGLPSTIKVFHGIHKELLEQQEQHERAKSIEYTPDETVFNNRNFLLDVIYIHKQYLAFITIYTEKQQQLEKLKKLQRFLIKK